MQSDRYVRAVLTVIAVCLVWICVRDVSLVETASADVGKTDVNIASIGGREIISVSPGLPVEVKNWPSGLQ
jgi:hypothetical protein